MFRMYWNDLRQQPGMGNFYARFQKFRSRPSWVWGIALLVGLVPFLIVIVMLGILAFIVTGVIYFLLATVHEIVSRITGTFHPSEEVEIHMSGETANDNGGRENVRVIHSNISE